MEFKQLHAGRGGEEKQDRGTNGEAPKGELLCG